MELTRRSFARASVAGAGTLAATACLANAGAAVADEAAVTAPPAYDATVPQTWDRECEVLVLGLGIAGCCALVEAYDLGADVLAVNSAASVIDCSCTRSGGWICGVGSRIQKAEGIEDSVDRFVDDIRRDGGDAGDPDIIRAWGEISGETIDWLQDLGCDVVQRTLDARTEAGSDAHSVARDYITNPVGGGLGWMMGLGDAIDERGIEVLWSTKATQLYRNAEGRVVGAHVEAMDGSSAEDIAASKGVILAVGGLGRDLNAHKNYTPSMREVVNEAAEVNFGCSENCLGNGYQMARDIDAYVFNSPPTRAATPASTTTARCTAPVGLSTSGAMTPASSRSTSTASASTTSAASRTSTTRRCGASSPAWSRSSSSTAIPWPHPTARLTPSRSSRPCRPAAPTP